MITPTDLKTISSQVQKLDSQVNLLNSSAVILGVLTAIVAVLSLVYNNKLSNAKDELAVVEKRQSDEKIALANSQARRAEEGTAIANQKAQSAVSTAEESKIKQQELAIESRKEQEKLAVAQKELADAQRKQAEAELALRKNVDEVKKKQAPRILTDEQKKIIVSVLSTSKGGPIQYFLGATDDETYRYSSEILSAIRDAGWKANMSDMYAVSTVGANTEGISITIRDKKNPPVHANKLAEALYKANIKYSVYVNPNIGVGMTQIVDPNTIEFFIGNKPKL